MLKAGKTGKFKNPSGFDEEPNCDGLLDDWARAYPKWQVLRGGFQHACVVVSVQVRTTSEPAMGLSVPKAH